MPLLYTTGMIDDLKLKISHFRSQLLLARYEQALEEGETIKDIIKEALSFGIDQQELQSLCADIEGQLDLAAKLHSLITHQPYSRDRKTKPDPKSIQPKRSVGKSKGKSAGKDSRTSKQKKSQPKVEEIADDRKFVGKWGKPKGSPVKKGTNTRDNKKQEFGYQSQNLAFRHVQQQHQQQETEDLGLPLQADEIQILQKNTILPLSLPEFFKTKEAHRLIVCYYEKCTHVLKQISSSLVGKYAVIQLDDLDFWSESSSTSSNKEKLYVIPFKQNREKLISRMLSASPNNLVVLYSGSERQLLTERASAIKDSGYKLRF